MDNRLKEIVDNFDSLKIGVDEPFRFHCTMCGKCCINREDILLTPRDMHYHCWLTSWYQQNANQPARKQGQYSENHKEPDSSSVQMF